ncbi:retrovirus-related pol polyprotein from transposon TNT 1-94 [Tanacetum coccineum]
MHYYQSLLIGDEYRQDEGDRRGIRHLMRLEKEMMKVEGEGHVRKAHLLEDKKIPSVGAFDEVFCIWKAFRRNTRDLGSFKEETNKTTDLHQHLSRISTQKLETASHITRNAVTTHLKTASQDLPTASDCYSQNSKAYIILNKHTRKIEESLNVTFDETPPPSKTSPLVDDDLDEEEAIKVTEKKNLENDIKDETLEIDEIVNIKESRNHPLENVIGNLNQRTLRSQAQNQSNFFCFISTIEPKNVNEALTDDSWIVAMQEELNQFIANDVWELVPQPRNMTIIETKWVFRNKLDENGIVSRNKARLVAQGYNQQEGIDYDETYAPVARLESIRILLAYACALDFKLFQMDVKSAFLNGFINEEVYVAQPPGFIDFEKPDYVYKLKKALYGLKQAPKAWYDRLKAFLIKHEYKMGMVDNTLFTKKKSSQLVAHRKKIRFPLR